MNAQIVYDDYGPQDTIGRLVCDGRWWDILTRAKADPLHPCLPPGGFNLTLGMHHPGDPKGYPCWHIWNADYPVERAFEIHIGNKWQDSLGCMLIGTEVVTVSGQREVLHSAQAHTQFMLAMNGNPGTLTITESPELIAKGVVQKDGL